MNLYTNIQSNTRKTWLYLAGFFVFVIAIGWGMSVLLGNPGILVGAIALSIAMSVASYWYSDKLVIAMSGAKPLAQGQNPELRKILEGLAKTANLHLPKIYIIQDKQPNAFATGRNAKHSVIAVTTGLLEKLDSSELEGVLAHELSHIGNKDMMLSAIVVALVGIVAIAADFFFRMAFWGGFRSRNGEGGQASSIILLPALVFLILAPIIARLIQFAVSRKREFIADASGVLLTRNPQSLAKALEKISQDVNQLMRANDATAHLYFASPFKGKEQASWIHRLFMTHPPIEERIRVLKEIAL